MRSPTFTAFLEPKDRVQVRRNSGVGYDTIEILVNGWTVFQLFAHNPGDLRDFPAYDSKHPLTTGSGEKAVHPLPQSPELAREE